MNPSRTADSGAQWGVSIPTSSHLADTPTIRSDASPDLAQNDFQGLFTCQSCGKHHTRLCDLTKHVKAHSRPFKCPVQDCRYHDWGWPTEKELDRHYNDKHSTKPRTFSCLWHDCSYSTKRESNCKQHMEKVHGYHYVRSRSGNQEEHTASPADTTGAVKNPFSQPKGKLAIRTIPNGLLAASSVQQSSPLAPTSASPLGMHGPDPYGQAICIPWNSPLTRLRNNEAFLREFSQSYNPGTPLAIQDHEWLRVPIDPRLQNASSTGNSTPDFTPTSSASSTRDALLRALPTIVTPRSSPIAMSQVLTPVSNTSPDQQSCINSEVTTPQDVEPPSHMGRSGVQDSGAGNSGYLNSYGKRQVRFENEQEDHSDEDDEPPMKRTRAPRGTDDDSGDPRMFCPFRVAHPEIYDVEVHSRYFSCHTEHNNISTVVRHLGRPAHNLKVDNDLQAIHSFDVPENEHGHPAAGLCKKCWRSFTDRSAFEAHTRSKCETASRSKREKFQALIDTFCSTEQDHRVSDTATDEDRDEVEDASASGTSSRSQSRIEDVVTRREYQSLADRVATLEQMLTGGMSQSTPRSMPAGQQHAVARAFTASPAMPSQAFGYYSFSPAAGTSSSAAASHEPRTSVLGGMDARPLESSGGSSAQTVTDFYNDTNRITPTAAYRSHTMNRRTDSVSTVRPATASPLVGGSDGSGSAAQQAGGNPSVGRAASDAAYGAGRAAAAGGDPSRLPSQSHHHQHHQAFGAMGVTSAVDDAGLSQQSTNSMMRNRWEHAVQVGDEMIMRGMDFFNGGQGSGDDLSKYLNMDSQ